MNTRNELDHWIFVQKKQSRYMLGHFLYAEQKLRVSEASENTAKAMPDGAVLVGEDVIQLPSSLSVLLKVLPYSSVCLPSVLQISTTVKQYYNNLTSKASRRFSRASFAILPKR